MNRNNDTCLSNWILLGIPFVSIISTIFHFIYEWSDNNILVGIIAPVNESIWEHLKLAFIPTLLWWTIGYICLSNKYYINKKNWFYSMVIEMLTVPLIIVVFYYTYTGALGINSFVLDALSLFVGIIGATYLSLHCYKYASFKKVYRYTLMTLIMIMTISFIICTFNPPKLPIFKDSLTGKYGILKN